MTLSHVVRTALLVALVLVVACSDEEEAVGQSPFGKARLVGKPNVREYANDLASLSDGSGFLVGQSGRDAWMVRLRPDLSPAWSLTFGADEPEVATSLFHVDGRPDGTAVVAGAAWAADRGALGFVEAVSRSGERLWRADFRTEGFFVQIVALAPVGDDGYWVVGTDSFEGPERLRHEHWVRRLAPDGEVRAEWRSARAPGRGEPFAAAATPDGGAVLVGAFAAEAGAPEDIWVERRSASGSGIWERRLAHPGAGLAQAVAVLRDGRIIVGGFDERGDRSQPRLLTFSADGRVVGDGGIDEFADRAAAFDRLALGKMGEAVGVVKAEAIPTHPGWLAAVRIRAGAEDPAGAVVKVKRSPTLDDVGGVAALADGAFLLAVNPATDVEAGDVSLFRFRLPIDQSTQ